ncbi:MAG: hypothetical protein V4538_05225 [Bacteroidota bacterium]
MKRVFALMLICSIVVAVSCQHKKEEQQIVNATDSCNAALTYTGGIKTLVDANCAYSGCHVVGTGAGDLTTYELLSSKASEINTRVVLVKNMPPSSMSDCNISKLDNWIKAGMPE